MSKTCNYLQIFIWLCAIKCNFFGTFQLPICCRLVGICESAFGVICEIETNNLKGMLPAVPVCSRRPWRCNSKGRREGNEEIFPQWVQIWTPKQAGNGTMQGHGMEGAGALKIGCSNFFNVWGEWLKWIVVKFRIYD